MVRSKETIIVSPTVIRNHYTTTSGILKEVLESLCYGLISKVVQRLLIIDRLAAKRQRHICYAGKQRNLQTCN